MITSNFVAGTYTALGGAGDATIHVNGPGVGTGGSTAWSLLAAAPDGSTPLINAQWTVGPLSDNPNAAAYMQTYGIQVDPNASFGFGQNPNYGGVFVAMTQTAENLAVRLYYYSSGLVRTITYTRTGP